MSVKLKIAGAKRDATMIVSFAAMLVGAIQVSTSFLQPLLAKHEWVWGVGMFLLSVTSMTIRWFEQQTLAEKAPDPIPLIHDDGTSSESQ